MESTSPLRLSASGVRAYLICPYQYARDYVDRLPERQREPVVQFAFGNSVHRALAGFFRAGAWACQTPDDLVSLLMRHWEGRAYPDLDTELRFFHRGKDMLERFYENRYGSEPLHELGIERQLAWTRPRQGILATGRVDRVCLMPGNVLEVIDFKIGAWKLRPGNLAQDLQAVFYRTLAAEAFRDLRPAQIRITFLYLSSSAPVSMDFQLDDFLYAWRQIEGTAAKIRHALDQLAEGRPLLEAFPHHRGMACQSCRMRTHCERLSDGAAADQELTSERRLSC